MRWLIQQETVVLPSLKRFGPPHRVSITPQLGPLALLIE